MRHRNWKKYNKQLIQRGSLTFLIDPKLLKKRKICKKIGRPIEYCDPLICMLMMVKIHHHLPYRALQGFMDSLAKLAKWLIAIPSYSLVCKRARKIKTLPSLSNRRPSVVILDASGMKVLGEGEWKVKVHGKGRRRKWVKIHIALDAKTQEIVAEVTTASSVKDGSLTENLLNNVKGHLEQVVADGSYEDQKSRGVVKQRGAKALIPPPLNGRVHGRDIERDDAIRIIKGLGGDKQGRSLWGKLTGYSIRALVETAFSRMKRLFGERLFSKTVDRQALENRLRCVILNRMRRQKVAIALALG